MFSGIIEEFATVVAIRKDRGNIDFSLKCSFADELKTDQSVAHNGVCLTVVSIANGTYTVTAMKETLERSNLSLLKVGDKVNIERSMQMNGRLDGHCTPRLLYCRQRQRNCQRCVSHCMQPHSRHFPGGHNTVHA